MCYLVIDGQATQAAYHSEGMSHRAVKRFRKQSRWAPAKGHEVDNPLARLESVDHMFNMWSSIFSIEEIDPHHGSCERKKITMTGDQRAARTVRNTTHRTCDGDPRTIFHDSHGSFGRKPRKNDHRR